LVSDIKLLIFLNVNVNCRFRIECTLFGTYVDKLNGFLSIGEVQNVVISIEFAKVKSFQGIILIFIISLYFFFIMTFFFSFVIFVI